MARALAPLLVALVGPLALWRWAVRLPPAGIEDDGYFYAGIAYNAGVNGIVSFDGIHPTDGFHMLWGYLLADASYLLSFFTRSRIAHLYLACALSVAAMAVVADRFGPRRTDKVLLFGLALMGTLLVETPLLTLFLLAMVLPDPPEETARLSERLPYALLAMAVSMTRLDASIMSLTWVVFVLLEGRRRHAMAIAVGILVGVVLQMLLNRMTAGAWTSVAAAARVDKVIAQFPRMFSYPGRTIFAWLLAAGSLAAVWRHVHATGERRWLGAWWAIGSFTVPHLFLGIRPWYAVPAFLGWTTLAMKVRDSRPGPASRLARASLTIAWLGVGGFVVVETALAFRYAEESKAVDQFVRDVTRLVPEGAAIFQEDGSGYIGFFSDRPVVNGDGFVNSHRYAQRLRAGQLAGYLDEEGIQFIVTNRPTAAGGLVVNRGGLVVSADELDELARKRGASVNSYTNFRLFRRKPPRDVSSPNECCRTPAKAVKSPLTTQLGDNPFTGAPPQASVAGREDIECKVSPAIPESASPPTAISLFPITPKRVLPTAACSIRSPPRPREVSSISRRTPRES
jgi:hypothetical protein